MKSHAQGDAAADGQALLELDNNAAAWMALRGCYILYPPPPWSIYLESGPEKCSISML